MKKIKVVTANAETFKDFGTVIMKASFEPDRVPGQFDWYGRLVDFDDIGSFTFNLMTVYNRKPLIEKFECHLKSKEIVIPIGGRGVIIPMAKPGPVDEDTIAAFYVPCDRAVVFDFGTWHFPPFPLDDSADFLTAYRRETADDDVSYAYPPYPMELEL